MDANIKERWLTALRSDKYQQTTGWLNKDDGYCCLGVLCELAVEDGIVTKNVYDKDDSIFEYVAVNDRTDDNAKILPAAVVEWAGLEKLGECPTVVVEVDLNDGDGSRERSSSLAELNDIAGFNFSQIANLIEDKF